MSIGASPLIGIAFFHEFDKAIRVSVSPSAIFFPKYNRSHFPLCWVLTRCALGILLVILSA